MNRKLIILVLICFFSININVLANTSQYYMSVAEDVSTWTEEEKDEFLIDKGLDEEKINNLYDKNLAIVTIIARNLNGDEIIEFYNSQIEEKYYIDAKDKLSNLSLFEQKEYLLEKGLSKEQVNNLNSENIYYLVLDTMENDYDKNKVMELYLSYTKRAGVKIVEFDVTINGIKIDNEYSEYPFLFYNNITYFPLTYRLNAFMGFESNFDGEKLVLTKSDFSETYEPYLKTTKNNMKSTFGVDTPNYDVYINGIEIQNPQDFYHPYINYKGVTYFPLTWVNVVDIFGYTLSFSDEEGLIINSR